MRRAITTTTILLLALAACSSGDDDSSGTVNLNDLAEATENAPPCTELLKAGRPTPDVVADLEQGACKDPDGATFIPIAVSWDCPDGRSVHHIDGWGWGFDDDVWNSDDVPEPYADCVLPGTDAQHP